MPTPDPNADGDSLNVLPEGAASGVADEPLVVPTILTTTTNPVGPTGIATNAAGGATAGSLG